MAHTLVDVRDLDVQLGGFRLQVPSWQVRSGRVVGLVGPNGAGKSTLLEHLVGLRGPNPGRVQVFGLDPLREPVAVRSDLGWATDDLPVWNMRIGRLLRRLSGYYPTWDPALVVRLVRRFGLPLDKRPGELSKGQGTRLRLVMAMAFRPRLLVLDEPGTGLDLAGRRTLLAEVLEVVSDEDRSVIVSSHQLADVQRIADELLVLCDGQVVRQGPTDELVGEERSLEEALLSWGAA
ncbi:MAG: ABC transporter ATP-binding protein [Myxococcales bacterium]|nr:ABC transporter ATP-binding protein [Myxococcales bacterium]